MGRGVRIEDADGLHKAIAHGIVTGRPPFTPNELRFLRKYLRQSQDGMARLLGSSEQTIARWEKGQTAIDPAAERLIRMVVLEALDDDVILWDELLKLADMDEAKHAPYRLERTRRKWRNAA
jgi:putative transcriptional regulator